MSSEFDDFMAAGAAEAFEVIGTVNIRCGQVAKGAVMSTFVATKEQRDSGFWNEITSTAEITRADFVALGIVDRSAVTVASRRMRVMRIEDDLHDPCVRVFLKPENV